MLNELKQRLVLIVVVVERNGVLGFPGLNPEAPLIPALTFLEASNQQCIHDPRLSLCS